MDPAIFMDDGRNSMRHRTPDFANKTVFHSHQLQCIATIAVLPQRAKTGTLSDFSRARRMSAQLMDITKPFIPLCIQSSLVRYGRIVPAILDWGCSMLTCGLSPELANSPRCYLNEIGLENYLPDVLTFFNRSFILERYLS